MTCVSPPFTCSHLGGSWGTCRRPLSRTINLTEARWFRLNGHFILILNEGTTMAIVHLVRLHVVTLRSVRSMAAGVVVGHSPLPSAVNARQRRWVRCLQTDYLQPKDLRFNIHFSDARNPSFPSCQSALMPELASAFLVRRHG